MNDPDEIKSDGQSRGPSLSRPGSTPQDPFRSGRSSERISLASTTDVKLDRLSPYGTKVPSLSTASQSYLPQRFFHSRRIKKGQAEKPWKTEKDPKDKWITIISVIGIVVGIAAAGAMIWDGYRSAVVHTYKLVLDQDFSTLTELDPKIWTKEVESGGFGTGQFDMTTGTDENAFIRDGMLQIKATLQDQKLIETNNVINLTRDGTCTSHLLSNCVTGTNVTNGTIVNPVKSARLNTIKGATIRYGKVEVVAKMPQGDWLWPAIWMMPVNSTYGQWPLSGEIDIVESRGNNHTYATGGNDIMTSTIHWGPDLANDAWWRTSDRRQALHSTFSAGFHTFGLEWSEKYIYMYLDSRLYWSLYNAFDQPLWRRGNFPPGNSTGTQYVDPWSQTGHYSTPFDQSFYLILNVAVGGTNGWFMDGASSKPWVDASPNAKHDFWNARDKWYSTWTQPAMQVKSIKMWQQTD